LPRLLIAPEHALQIDPRVTAMQFPCGENAAMDRFASFDTFVTVYETGSFSAAARKLAVGQPAVSKSVALLESHLGTRLLTRSSRKLVPTEAGHRFYTHARQAIEAAAAAELAARGAAANLRGQVSVSAATTFARLHIIPRLPLFLAQHPELSVDIQLDDGNVDLFAEGVEVALRMGDLADSGLTAQRIARGRRAVVGTPAYFEARGEPRIPQELMAHEAIVYSRGGGGANWSFQREGIDVSVAVHGRVTVSVSEGVRAAVLAGVGLAIASEWMFSPELASGEVRRVLTDWSLPSIDLWAVYPAGRMATARARAFVEFVRESLDVNDGQV
jgi:DNA-binding transcriptional LysR family regulator